MGTTSETQQVIVLQHASVETLGTLAEVLRAQEIQPWVVHLYAGEAGPQSLESAAGLIIMGGPMGVYDQADYPFLRHEMRLLEDALKRDKPILGICLGSQLLAAALGSEVRKGRRREIGWHRVKLTAAAQSDRLWEGTGRSFTAFHWHGNFFDLPRHCVSLACSELTRYQAFRYGTTGYGFLFHIETTEDLVADMVRGFPQEAREADVSAEQIVVDAKRNLPALRQISQRVLGRWCGLLRS